MKEKKVKYSKPYKRLYAEIKAVDVKRIQKMTEDEAEVFIQMQNKMNRKIGNTHTAFDIVIRNLRGEAEQIFIQDEALLEFLEETEVRDLTDFKQLFEPDRMCIIHLPNRENSVGVWLEPMEHDSLGVKDSENKMEFLYIQTGNSNLVSDVNTFNKKNKGVVKVDGNLVEKDEEGEKLLSLAVNTFAYMSAFPEMIKNGLPKGCVMDKGRSAKKSVLQIEPSLIEKKEHGVKPHLRRGHFRYLSSDYFKKKQNQWVFVKASFVGSKEVKTVESA